jgi:predicted DNA-binding ribbon-helix-helix protein
VFDRAEANCRISPCLGADPCGSAALIQAIRGRTFITERQPIEKKARLAEVREMRSGETLIKRSVRIAGHATSVSLEPAFWQALLEIAALRGLSVNVLVAMIDAERTGNLSSALRVFILESCRGGELGAVGEASLKGWTAV